jgi:tetratricopeptide (TPR) repeat protein
MERATAWTATRRPNGDRKVAVEDQALQNRTESCVSGKKYKRCCMANDKLAAREKLAANAAAAAATHQPSNFCDDCTHQLDDAADAVFALIDAKKFDEAEQAALDVLARFPGVHDGYECLGRLYQAKGDHDRAIEYYRRVIAFARRTSMARNSWITSRT